MMMLVPLKKTNFVFCYGVPVLFTESFDVWYDNSGSFYEYTCSALWMRVWIIDNFAEMGWLEV